MPRFVSPKVFLIGYSQIDENALNEYLAYTDNTDFMESAREAHGKGLSDGEILCSFYAKLCYKSLTLGKNANVTRVRDISSNIEAAFDMGHGSVFEHASINFVVTDCSRVYCYHPDTDVFTTDGWVNIQSLKAGDTLLTMNPSTGKAEWQEALSTHKFPYKEQLYGWTTSQMQSPLMTPNHILWAAKHDLRRARNLSLEENSDRFSEKVEFGEVFGKQFVIKNKIDFDGHDEQRMIIGVNEYDALDVFEWLGWMATDGTFSRDKPNQSSISQSKVENLPRITSLMNNMFQGRWRRHGPYSDGGVTMFTVSDSAMAEFGKKHLGETKATRSFSQWLIDSSDRLLRRFVKSAILGDGSTHKDNGHQCLYVPCKKAAGQFQVIFSRLGTPANLRVDNRAGQEHPMPDGTVIRNSQPCYVIDVDRRGGASLIRKRHQFQVNYDGEVFCPKTQNGIIYVRNMGQPFWAGNTHEQVRHRVGVAYSQTSGRYVRGDRLDFITDPILAEYNILTPFQQEQILTYLENIMRDAGKRIEVRAGGDFSIKKKLTSALRRFLPNGQSNEMGMTVNFRSLRHTVEVRTSRHAEREIRDIFGQVYTLTKEKFPLLYHGAKEEVVDGLLEVSGMKHQPY